MAGGQRFGDSEDFKEQVKMVIEVNILKGGGREFYSLVILQPLNSRRVMEEHRYIGCRAGEMEEEDQGAI